MSPFRYRLFIALLLASTISYVGNFVHLMAATWLMTDLTTSKFLVALIQTAGYLPFFLCTFPAGLLADFYNRRKLLLIIQAVMLATVVAMVILVYTHAINPGSLLLITFILNICAGLMSPAWQLAVTDMVPHELLSSAVTLNSLGYNVARAIGPALGGIILGTLGSTAPFIFDAFSYLGILIVLYCWSGKSITHQETPEFYPSSLFAGFHYVWHDPGLRWNCIQAVLFFLAGSSIWTLLALVAKHTLKTTAIGYGLVFGALGLGAIIGALVLLKFRERWQYHQIIRSSILAYAIACFGLVMVHHLVMACLFCLIAGFAWLAINTSFNIHIQRTAPPALKARVYAVYLMANSGMLALGSLIFGAIAEHTNTELSLLIAGIFLLLLWLLPSLYKSRLQAQSS
jgi:MFS family permease